MPFYQLLCHDCGAAFEKQASIKDREEKRIYCPKCGSMQLEPDYSLGSAHVQIKQNQDKGYSCPHGGGCGCSGCCGGSR